MSLSDLASLGSFVSGLAVLASLGFLYFQMRQMTEQVRQAEKNQQAVIRQGRANALIELNLFAADGEVANSLRPVMSAEPVEDIVLLDRYFAFARALLQHLAENFDQFRAGLLNDSDFEGFVRSTAMIFGSAAMRVTWKRCRPMFKDDFIAFMDERFATAPVTKRNPQEFLAQWNADIEAELSKGAQLIAS